MPFFDLRLTADLPSATKIVGVWFVVLIAGFYLLNRHERNRRGRRLSLFSNLSLAENAEKGKLGSTTSNFFGGGGGGAQHERENTTQASKAAIDDSLEKDKLLYHKLLNIEQNQDVLEEAHDCFRKLLSLSTHTALTTTDSLLSSVPYYDETKVLEHLKRAQDSAESRFQAYIQRRSDNGPREMFVDLDEAKWWLRNSALVKYVDGAWLQTAFTADGPQQSRELLWRVMSEELGDGDLQKNHVALYAKLMEDINANLPPAHSKDFISPNLELNESRCWRAALAQVLISLFPKSYVPEMIGFVLAYESLPYHLLVTVHELKELKLDAYYFVLHVSIDNSDCGHAKMSYDAVTNYMNDVPVEDKDAMWRRICAGYELADALPTTPDLDRRHAHVIMGDMISRKAEISHGVHAGSKAKICGRKVVDWLDPEALKTQEGRTDALRTLADSKAWITKGSPEKSRLMKSMQWGGNMYGAFTTDDVVIVENWIRSLKTEPDYPSRDEYEAFVGAQYLPQTPVQDWEFPMLSYRSKNDSTSSKFASTGNTVLDDLSRMFGSLNALEIFLGPPSKSANPTGMRILQLLRIIHGYGPHTDVPAESLGELGRRICKANNISYYEVLDAFSANMPDEITDPSFCNEHFACRHHGVISQRQSKILRASSSTLSVAVGDLARLEDIFRKVDVFSAALPLNGNGKKCFGSDM